MAQDTNENDWGFTDPNDWGFGVPNPGVGPRRFNPDLREEQGLDETEVPDYGTLVQRREIFRKGQMMVVFIFSTGWIETWYWKHCPQYMYKEGYIVGGEWFPPDWGRELDNDEWWESKGRYKV